MPIDNTVKVLCFYYIRPKCQIIHRRVTAEQYSHRGVREGRRAMGNNSFFSLY